MTNQQNRNQPQANRNNNDTSKPKEHPLNDPKQDPARKPPMGQQDSRTKR